ncbi:MAG: 5'/3'-nucleotidase SurE [Chitinispirillaceae bacterium]|nr:5'/3'-nucleotidase SurE [Chitinispirillaceae bacterium]
MITKKRILLTNDDGFETTGIRVLYDILKDHYEITVVAPEKEKSGVGHSFTYKAPLFYKKVEDSYGKNIYAVKGSPADCVKLAVSYLLPEKPDIIISGINIGENSGICAYYSGTVAGAREGAFWKIKSFAFSLSEEAKEYLVDYASMIPKIIESIVEISDSFKSDVFFNVNFPNCAPEEIKGIKITKQSMACFDDKYEEVKIDGSSEHVGLRIYGDKVGIETSDEYDSRAILNGWIAITPLSFDATAYSEFDIVKNIERTSSIKRKKQCFQKIK